MNNDHTGSWCHWSKYKFIKISPVNQKDFIVKTEQGVSLLPNGVQ